jgi:hypothetical protein
MGAFDGIRLPYSNWISPNECTEQFEYFRTQTAFQFFEGFGLPELRVLLAQAKSNKEATVWVPKKYEKGSIGLSTWYVEALIAHAFEK